MSEPNLDHDPELIRSFDGTLLAVRRMGRGDGLPLLVCNAIGANLAAWRRALIDIARERTIVTWDHRGLYDSAMAASDRIDAGAHAEDAIAALDHHDIEHAFLASWGSGARVAFELAHRYPDRFTGLVVVCGGFGYALSRLLSRLELASALPTLAGVGKHFASFLEGPLRAITSRPEVSGLIRQSGMIAATADTSALVDLLRGMADQDMKTLLRAYEEVAGDPAPELLPTIQAPTLLVAGERDPFTPRAVSEEMARAIPDATLVIYDKATHYLPIEYPARLSRDMRDFFARVA